MTPTDVFRRARDFLVEHRELSDLTKTVSGKIRRVELRRRETERGGEAPRGPLEFWQEDLPELKAEG